MAYIVAKVLSAITAMGIILVQILLASDTTSTARIADHAGGLQEAYIVFKDLIATTAMVIILVHKLLACKEVVPDSVLEDVIT